MGAVHAKSQANYSVAYTYQEPEPGCRSQDFNFTYTIQKLPNRRDREFINAFARLTEIGALLKFIYQQKKFSLLTLTGPFEAMVTATAVGTLSNLMQTIEERDKTESSHQVIEDAITFQRLTVTIRYTKQADPESLLGPGGEFQEASAT